MDTHKYSTSNPASSSSSSHSNSSNSSAPFPSQQEERSAKPPPAYRSALHSVRKIPAKNIITKKPIAPMPPVPPKIYRVDPVDFKNVVQRLTAAPEFQPTTRLQEVAPPPLSLSPRHQLPVVHPSVKMQLSGKSSSLDSSSGSLSPLGFSLSPSSLAWCSSILLSPRTLSSLEPSAVL